ncbi:unnamed protein product [Closterium sp. NIES-65]|nr:unnamed protein product [Closterium sp. NIES-65]
MTPPTGAKQAGGAPLPDCPATPLLTLSRRLLLSPRTSRACNSQGMTGGALSRREARVCLTAALPPFSSVHPNPASPHLPPHAPPRCGLVAHSAGGRRAFACLPHSPPSLPITPIPLPPIFPRMRLSGQVWCRTQQVGGAPLPDCPARSPFSSYHPNPASPAYPPHAAPTCGLVAHSAGGRSPSPCTLPPLSPAHPPFRGGSHMTLVAHSADGYVECLF